MILSKKIQLSVHFKIEIYESFKIMRCLKSITNDWECFEANIILSSYWWGWVFVHYLLLYWMIGSMENIVFNTGVVLCGMLVIATGCIINIRSKISSKWFSGTFLSLNIVFLSKIWSWERERDDNFLHTHILELKILF